MWTLERQDSSVVIELALFFVITSTDLFIKEIVKHMCFYLREINEKIIVPSLEEIHIESRKPSMYIVDLM